MLESDRQCRAELMNLDSQAAGPGRKVRVATKTASTPLVQLLGTRCLRGAGVRGS